MATHRTSPLDALRAPGTVKHFIGGAWVESADGQTFETTNPAARKAFDEGPWPRMRPAERARILRKVRDLITERAPEIARTGTLDAGLPRSARRSTSPTSTACWNTSRSPWGSPQ